MIPVINTALCGESSVAEGCAWMDWGGEGLSFNTCGKGVGRSAWAGKGLSFNTNTEGVGDSAWRGKECAPMVSLSLWVIRNEY